MKLASRTVLLVILAMVAFAANSLLCRMALKNRGIDAGSFTTIRIVAGAVVLWLIVCVRDTPKAFTGNGLSAVSLFIYAAGFSYAYVKLPAATGALMLFGAVQATMITYGLWRGERMGVVQQTIADDALEEKYGLWRGERMGVVQVVGFCTALAGLIYLLLPGLSAPSFASSAVMLTAGVAWGIYTLRGKGTENPIAATAGNFLRAVPFAVLLFASGFADVSLDSAGVCYAAVSGGLASGVGYAIWYAALPGLKATKAATVQLSVPVIAAAGGVVILGETISPRLLLSSVGILGGIALVILSQRR